MTQPDMEPPNPLAEGCLMSWLKSFKKRKIQFDEPHTDTATGIGRATAATTATVPTTSTTATTLPLLLLPTDTPPRPPGLLLLRLLD